MPPLAECRYERGHLKSIRYFGKSGGSLDEIASPSGALILYSTNGSFCFNRATRTIRPIPNRDFGYAHFAPSSELVQFKFQAVKIRENEFGYGVSRTDTWKEIWRQAGAASPLWDIEGKKLVFARYQDGAAYSTHTQFPGSFAIGPAHRRKNTHWFVADFSRYKNGSKPDVRRISEKEAAHLVGGWFSTYLRLHIDNDHNSLSAPQNGQVLPAPRGQGVLVRIKIPVSTTYKEPGTDLEHALPFDMIGHAGSWLLYADKHGRMKRYEAQHVANYVSRDVNPVCWSRDGIHLYGEYRGMGNFADESATAHLCRFNAQTGKLDKALMPKKLNRLITFVENAA